MFQIISYRPFYKIYISISFFFVILAIGTVGYMFLENYNFLDALYMTVITLATVGYGEVQALSDTGRIFTIILILTNIGAFTYFISMITHYFMDGEFNKALKIYRMNEEIKNLKDHVIVCGLGRNGREALNTLLRNGIKVVVIETIQEKLDLVNTQNFVRLEEDATKDESLVKAGIGNAKALITTLPNDADNVFVVLTARELNKNITIISRASQDSSVKKLKIAGANNVIMPDKMGGSQMASLVFNPDIKEFLDEMSYTSSANFKIVELSVSKNIPLSELNAWAKTGCRILGLKQNGEYILNPGPSEVLTSNTILIVMGSDVQLKKLELLL